MKEGRCCRMEDERMLSLQRDVVVEGKMGRGGGRGSVVTESFTIKAAGDR